MSRCCTTEIFCRASSSGRAVDVTSRSTSRRSSNRYCSIASRMRAWLDELELLAGLEGHHGLAHHFLAERHLAGVRHLDLLLDRAQEALVRRARLARDGVGHLAVIERGFHLVQIFLEQLLRLLFEGGEHRAMHVFLHPAVVELLARGDEVIDPALLLLGIDARVVLDAILQREQQLHAGEAVASLPRVMALEMALMMKRGLMPVRPSSGASLRSRAASVSGMPSTASPAYRRSFFGDVQALALGLRQPREYREHRGEVQHVRIEVHVAERRRAGDELLVDARLVA